MPSSPYYAGKGRFPDTSRALDQIALTELRQTQLQTFRHQKNFSRRNAKTVIRSKTNPCFHLEMLV